MLANVPARIGRREAVGGVIALVAGKLVGCKERPAEPSKGLAATMEPDVARATVLQRIRAHAAVDGQGATLQRVFPSPQLRHLDPFVLLDDFNVRRPAGFPEHPHRGFEAFTYMIEGAFHHRDNLGNDSVIGVGGTQRFTSGRGARHSEMPASDGNNRGLQLWVNLPRRLKKMEPSYRGLDGDALPFERADGVSVRVISGSSSPVDLQTEVDYLDVGLVADARFSRTVPEGWNALLYVMDGEVSVLGETLTRGDGLLPSAGEVVIQAFADARFAWLAGNPHREPIRHRGPFVD